MYHDFYFSITFNKDRKKCNKVSTTRASNQFVVKNQALPWYCVTIPFQQEKIGILVRVRV